MRIIFTGDTVGKIGRKALYHAIARWRAELEPHLIISNGENAAGGRGITPPLIHEFHENGVDVITLGDHVWDQQDFIDNAEKDPYTLRPFNLQPGVPGRGSILIDTSAGKVGVLCLMGQALMRSGALNPFTVGYDEALRLREQGARAIIVEIHGESTAEKTALGYRMDGLVSAVLGTHTHVQTADARILPAGTAFICDVGMCGSKESVIGREVDITVNSMVSSLPAKLDIGRWPAQVNGALIEVDENSGLASRILPLNLNVEDPQ